jgi:hypothetical protein
VEVVGAELSVSQFAPGSIHLALRTSVPNQGGDNASLTSCSAFQTRVSWQQFLPFLLVSITKQVLAQLLNGLSRER